MITVHIVTTKNEYVAKVQNMMIFQTPGWVVLDDDACYLRRMLVTNGPRVEERIQLDKVNRDKAFTNGFQINTAHVIEVRHLDEKGPFYKYYMEQVSGLSLVHKVIKATQ